MMLSLSPQVRFVCISDTHSQVEQAEDPAPFSVPDGDVLIHAGDMTQWGEVPKVKEFNDWIGNLPHKHKARIFSLYTLFLVSIQIFHAVCRW